jgi:hypothetical protein
MQGISEIARNQASIRLPIPRRAMKFLIENIFSDSTQPVDTDFTDQY